MTDPREIARRTSEARRLLDEPLLNEAFERIERMAVEELLQRERSDDDGRRLMADYIRTVRNLRKYLEHVIANGEQALKPAKRLA